MGKCEAIDNHYIPEGTNKPEKCDDNCKECETTAKTCTECYED